MTTCRDNNDAHSSESGVKNGSQGTHLLLINQANCKKIELVSSITIALVSSYNSVINLGHIIYEHTEYMYSEFKSCFGLCTIMRFKQ